MTCASINSCGRYPWRTTAHLLFCRVCLCRELSSKEDNTLAKWVHSRLSFADHVDAHGRLYLDSDPELFSHILSYIECRDPSHFNSPGVYNLSTVRKERWLAECRFYNLRDLALLLTYGPKGDNYKCNTATGYRRQFKLEVDRDNHRSEYIWPEHTHSD